MKYAPVKKDKKKKINRGAKVKISTIGTYLMFLVVGVAMAAYIVADWSAEHQLVRQKVLEVNVQMPFRVEDIPDEIISPLAVEAKEEVTEEDLSDLTAIEQKILDAFGVRNFNVMRAIAVCESRMNPEGVNWQTGDVGLYQINWSTWRDPIAEEFGYTIADMFDVDKNIEVAKWIWDRDGDGEGDISPWVATGTECFRNEL